jgi:tricorn protease
MWVGGPLLFTSDRAATFPGDADEQANLWAWDGLADAAPGEGATPDAPRQVTFQTAEQGYVRDATTDGTRVAWHSRGDLWVLDSLDGTPRRLDITLTSAAPQPYAAEPRRIDGLATDQGGDGSLIGWLGTAFWVTHRAGPARVHLRERYACRRRKPVRIGFGQVREVDARERRPAELPPVVAAGQCGFDLAQPFVVQIYRITRRLELPER